VSAAEHTAISAADARLLLDFLAEFPVLLIAVSGGPDSTALLWLATRWRKALRRGPRLVAVTVDHGLRPAAKREAQAVASLTRALGVEHRIVRWTGAKPKTGVQEAARQARYRLLAEVARKVGARHVLTAHTLDDQAETVLIRLARGSGIAGLAAMALASPVPIEEARGVMLVRPLLRTPKSRLIATLKAAKLPYADDPSNRDAGFTRVRMRELMPALAREGLTPARLARLAHRVDRMETAVEIAVSEAGDRIAPGLWPDGGPVTIETRAFFELPGEIALRLLGRAIALVGDEGPVELGKLEVLNDALHQAGYSGRFRRSLAGALVTLSGEWLTVEQAPPRRRRALKRP
jgi:tRNA(Ile)-lysidine synthase